MGKKRKEANLIGLPQGGHVFTVLRKKIRCDVGSQEVPNNNNSAWNLSVLEAAKYLCNNNQQVIQHINTLLAQGSSSFRWSFYTH